MATLRPAEAAALSLAPARFRVERRRRETADTWTVELAPLDDPIEPAPGQFTMVYSFGSGEVPISVSGYEPVAGRIIHTVRAVGPVTRSICAMRRGAVLGLRGPFGTTWPLDELAGSDLVIVAGGLGLAPLRSSVEHALAHRADYGRLVVLHGARTPADLLYRRDLSRWRGRFDVAVDVTVDAAGRDWSGAAGVVPDLITGAEFDPEAAAALVCGPEVMMRFAATALLRRGVPARRIFVSLERNMHCGVGQCGHCQLGPFLLCRDGPVLRYDRVAPSLTVRER
jgi:NAD(P)H-flavin reductase